MKITSNRLTATAGLCAATAGAIFIGVQVNHPPADVAHLVSTEMAIRMTAKVLFCALALVGLAGIFVRDRHQLGRLGRVGYSLLSVGFLAMLVQECVIGYYLPTVAHSEPVYVQHVLNGAMAHGESSGIGAMQGLFLIAGMGYAVGGLLFGIALFRAGVLPRWASVLLAYGTTSALALAALPESFSRPFAVPTGVALIALGLSLWRDQRRQAETVDAPSSTCCCGCSTRRSSRRPERAATPRPSRQNIQQRPAGRAPCGRCECSRRPWANSTPSPAGRGAPRAQQGARGCRRQPRRGCG